MFNGVTITLDKNNPDTDGDGLWDGEEVVELNYQYNEDKTQVIVTGKLVTNPLTEDSDGDGVKGLGKVVKFIGSNLDNIPMVVNAFEFMAKNFSDEVIQKLAGIEMFQVVMTNLSSADNLKITKRKTEMMNEVAEKAGMSEYKMFTVKGTWKYKDGFAEHLIKGTLGKGSKGVIGGHNYSEFKKVLIDAGFNYEDCVKNIKKHPNINGIYEIEYRIPAKQYGATGELEIIPNQYKNIKYPKTVYDPDFIADEQMIQWGKEAMENGITNGRNISGYASNGLKFEGYIDLTTGEITNFYPVLE